MSKKAKRKIVKRAVDNLRPHPRQSELFPDLDDTAFKALVKDIKDNELINPVEIQADGTIICGHQRVRAARQLGWEEIRCWVRTDLEEAGNDAVERRLIEDNAKRPQLKPLDKAWYFLEWKQLQKGSGGVKRDDAFIKEHFGKSRESLNRLIRILGTPFAVQRAYEEHQLTQILAKKVSNLDGKVQEELAERIRAGEEPKEVVAEYVESDNGQPKQDGTVWQRFLRAIEQFKDDVEDRGMDIPRRLRQDDLPLLEWFAKNTSEWVQFIEDHPAETIPLQQRIEEIAAKLKGRTAS